MRPDDILLVDMLLATREVLAFTSDISWEKFQDDRMRQLAVVKAMEIIGEAASQLSEEFRSQHWEIPWREIIGMRHRLVHGYFEIDIERVWRTAREDVPGFLSQIEPLVPPEVGR